MDIGEDIRLSMENIGTPRVGFEPTTHSLHLIQCCHWYGLYHHPGFRRLADRDARRFADLYDKDSYSLAG